MPNTFSKPEVGEGTYQAWDHHSTLFLEHLPNDEDDCHQDEANEETDHGAAMPRHTLPSILKCQDVRGDQTYDERGTDQVKLQHLFSP